VDWSVEALLEGISYTFSEYCLWSDDQRRELIEGVPVAMAPALSLTHQTVSGSIHSQLYTFLSGKPCSVFAAPFDVRLYGGGALR